MGKPRNNTAAGIYRRFLTDVSVLIDWLNDELAALDDNAAKEPDNWKFAVATADVRQQLRQIVMDLSHMDSEQAERGITSRRRKRGDGK